MPIPEPDLTIRKNIVNTSEHPPSCTAIIIDNFYNNPMQMKIRKYYSKIFEIRGIIQVPEQEVLLLLNYEILFKDMLDHLEEKYHVFYGKTR